MTYKILRAQLSDAEEILKIQKKAYASEAERYNNYNIPPLTQTLEEIKEHFQTHIFLKAVAGGQIVASVRAYAEKGTCYISRLAVLPEEQNQGIGTALMKEIEKCFNVKRFELFVGAKSHKNIHLYQKLGYNICDRCGEECGHVEILYMEKITRR